MGGDKTGAEAPAYSRPVPLGRKSRNREVLPNSKGRSRPAIKSGAESPHSKIKTFSLTRYNGFVRPGTGGSQDRFSKVRRTQPPVNATQKKFPAPVDINATYVIITFSGPHKRF
jgi:hypothetical protein